METQKTPHSQSNLKGNKRSWRNQTPWLHTILQSCSNQDNMVLAQKQKYQSVEQDRKPRGKPTHLWSTNLWQRRQGYTMEKTVSSISGAWGTSLVAQWFRIRLPMQGTWVRALVREDPTCHRATKPRCHNYWACALEPTSHNYWAHMPQLQKPVHLEPRLHNRRGHRSEKPVHHNKE